MPLDHMPEGALVIEPGKTPGSAYYAAKWRASADGRQVKRRLGRAWLEPDGAGDWRPRSGRIRSGWLDARRAHIAMAELIERVEDEDRRHAELQAERELRTSTFRELADAWLEHVERVERAKPSTLATYRSVLAEPGAPVPRGVAQASAARASA